MSGQRCNFLHRGVLPHDHLVKRVAMSAYQLIVSLWENQITDLRPCVDCANWLQGLSVPKPDVLICCATASRKQSAMKRTPINRFDSCTVLTKSRKRFRGLILADLPDHQFVVVSSRCKRCFIVRAPAQSTHFLAMRIKSVFKVRLASHVAN